MKRLCALLLVAACQPQPRWTDAEKPAPVGGWEACWSEAATPPPGPWIAIPPGDSPPGRNGRAQAWFRARLPQGHWADPAIFLEGVDSRFEAWAAGKPVYRYGDPASGPTRRPEGFPWHLFAVPAGAREIFLRVGSSSPLDIGPRGRGLAGSRSDLLFSVLTWGAREALAGILGLFLGFLAVLVWARRRDERHYLFFGVYVAAQGLSLLALSEPRLLLWDAPSAWMNLLVAARLLGPIALCGLVDDLSARRHLWLGRFWRGALAASAMCAAVLFFDFRAYAVLWRFLNLEFFACMIAAIFVAARAALRGSGEARAFVVGLLVWGVTSLHDALLALHTVGGGRWSGLGFLVFAAVLGAIQLSRFVAVHQRLQRHALEVERKNAALKKTELDLNAALQVRDEFLSVASHELRTPITSLLLQAQLLGRRVREPGIDLIVRQADRLSRLTDSLLDVSRVRGGKLELNLEPVDLPALVREVAGRFEEQSRRAGSPIGLQLPDALLGQWDRLRLDQLVTNLLSNALKYGAGQPAIVTVARAGPLALLIVADRGIGLAPESQERIFGRFERAVSSRTYPGLGLGLWISREIVTAHGGRIQVESALGEGARFTVELPLEPA